MHKSISNSMRELLKCSQVDCRAVEMCTSLFLTL